jgi:hypothetical protein
MKKVLLVGLDPHAVPGVDATLVDQAIAMSDARFAAAQIECVSCLFPPERSAAVAALDAAFTDPRAPYDCIVIGGGLRKPDDLVALFEDVLDRLRRAAPSTPIAFNTNPVTSVDAAMRWLQ